MPSISAILYVNDLERMRRFYTDLFGIQPTNQEWTDTWASFNLGACRFDLHAIPPEIAKQIEVKSPPVQREETPVKLVFAVDGFVAFRAKMASLGVAIIDRPWQNAAEECDAVDPEGNIFQIRAA